MLGAGNYDILGFLVKLDEKGAITTRSYDEVFVFLGFFCVAFRASLLTTLYSRMTMSICFHLTFLNQIVSHRLNRLRNIILTVGTDYVIMPSETRQYINNALDILDNKWNRAYKAKPWRKYSNINL
jgi:hypothetical protein